MDKQPDAIDLFKSAVLVAAADAVLKEMTEEKMRACAERIISDALADLTSSPYGNLRRQVQGAAETMMTDYLKQEGTQADIRRAVESGINLALVDMPAATKGKVIDIALKGLTAGIESTRR